MILSYPIWYQCFENKKLINVVIDRLINEESNNTSDYTDYAHEDILCMADDLEMGCNPYINDDIGNYLIDFIDVNEEDNFDTIFKNVFLCLEQSSIQLIFGKSN